MVRGNDPEGRGRAKSLRAKDSFTFNDIVAVKLVKLAELVRRSYSRIYEKKYGLKNADLRIIGHLSSDVPLTVREISRQSKIDKAWISRSVEGLVKREIVQRETHPSDSRVALLSLTEAGKELAETIRQLAYERQQRLLKGMPQEEIQRILDALTKRLERADEEA